MGKDKEWSRSDHISGGRPDVRSRPVGETVDLEVSAILDMLEEDLIADGWDPQEAREEALRRFGDPARVGRSSRSVMHAADRRRRLADGLGTLARDTGYGWRMLRRSPGISLVTALILALGIGASATIYTAVQALLLRDLPYPEPDRLVTIYHYYTMIRSSVSIHGYNDYRQRPVSYATMGIARGWTVNLTGLDVPERVFGGLVSAGYLETIGVAPAVGRFFLPEEDRAGNERVVILSDEFWQSRKGGQTDVLGTTLRLNGESHVVVGVMPPGFTDPILRGSLLWRPLAFPPEALPSQGYITENYGLVARLAPGISIEAAQLELDALADELRIEHPELVRYEWQLGVDSLAERAQEPYKGVLALLAGAVGLVLLIACANVANLLLARGLGRRKEMAIRAALGAGRRVIIRQLLVESALLAFISGLMGLGLAIAGTRGLERFGSPDLARAGMSLDLGVLLFTVAISVGAAMLFGLVPALQGARLDAASVLRMGGRGSRSESGSRRLRKGLVIVELSLALILLAGAGLMVRSLAELQQVDPGFEAEDVLITRLTLPRPMYAEQARANAFYEDLMPRLRACGS